MHPPILLSDSEKDRLLIQQQEMIERLVTRITELEALVGKPRKTSSNSHVPPSKDGFGFGKKRRKPSSGKRPPREGRARPLAEVPDKTERVMASSCGHCGTDCPDKSRIADTDMTGLAPLKWRGICSA